MGAVHFSGGWSFFRFFGIGIPRSVSVELKAAECVRRLTGFCLLNLHSTLATLQLQARSPPRHSQSDFGERTPQFAHRRESFQPTLKQWKTVTRTAAANSTNFGLKRFTRNPCRNARPVGLITALAGTPALLHILYAMYGR